MLIARWPNAETSSSSLIHSILSQRGAVPGKRWSVQIRAFRLPDAPATNIGGGGGRNLIVFRSSEREGMGIVFIEDPRAPLRRVRDEQRTNHQALGTEDTTSLHTRWTTTVLGNPSPTSSSLPFDQLLHRVLCTPIAQNTGAWAQKSSSVIIDGYDFILEDFLIRVGAVQSRGGAAATPKGILIQATYLPVPSLPSSSKFMRDHILSLLPPRMAAHIEFLEVDDEAFVEAGLSPRLSPSTSGGEAGKGEHFEWTASHSAWMLMRRFKQEELF